MKEELFFSVDIESTGPVPFPYSMYELGACVVGHADTETFFSKLALISDAHEPAALRACGVALEDLKLVTDDPKTVMQNFDAWIADVCARLNGEPIFIAWPTSFDWSFVNWYFHNFLGRNPFGFAAPDMRTFYMGMMNYSWRDSSKSKMDKRFQTNRPHTHNALDDAKEQAERFEKMRAYRNTLKF